MTFLVCVFLFKFESKIKPLKLNSFTCSVFIRYILMVRTCALYYLDEKSKVYEAIRVYLNNGCLTILSTIIYKINAISLSSSYIIKMQLVYVGYYC